jgi:hypothetical protein
MIDWSLPPDIQAQYDRVLEQNRRLQKELGIKPMTIEDRHQAYLKRQADPVEQQRREELRQIQERVGKMRPPPKWKV